jgi:hypothetical protein
MERKWVMVTAIPMCSTKKPDQMPPIMLLTAGVVED